MAEHKENTFWLPLYFRKKEMHSGYQFFVNKPCIRYAKQLSYITSKSMEKIPSQPAIPVQSFFAHALLLCNHNIFFIGTGTDLLQTRRENSPKVISMEMIQEKKQQFAGGRRNNQVRTYKEAIANKL
jgi:hypothetical protein